MRALSERQYDAGRSSDLNEPIEAALKGWLRILRYGQPRPIPKKIGGNADAVIFTDGSTDDDGNHPVIGGVAFMWWKEAPTAFSVPVAEDLIHSWLPTKNAITLIEIFAAVAAIEHHGPELIGKRVTLLIDSEAALDALIKGYSRFEDVALIVTAFWELVAKYQVNVYLDRVPTDSNISDGMSRARSGEIQQLAWHQVYPDLLGVIGRNSDIRRDLGLGNKRTGTGTIWYRESKRAKTAKTAPPDHGSTGAPPITAAPGSSAQVPESVGRRASRQGPRTPSGTEGARTRRKERRGRAA